MPCLKYSVASIKNDWRKHHTHDILIYITSYAHMKCKCTHIYVRYPFFRFSFYMQPACEVWICVKDSPVYFLHSNSRFSRQCHSLEIRKIYKGVVVTVVACFTNKSHPVFKLNWQDKKRITFFKWHSTSSVGLDLRLIKLVDGNETGNAY